MRGSWYHPGSVDKRPSTQITVGTGFAYASADFSKTAQKGTSGSSYGVDSQSMIDTPWTLWLPYSLRQRSI